MNKKTIIQMVIIVVAFGAAGFVLYNGLFKSSGSTGPQPVSSTAPAAAAQPILPYGNTLDFSKVLNANRFQYNQIVYPQLNPSSDVGIPVNNLITPGTGTP